MTTLSSQGRVQVSPVCGTSGGFTGGRWESQASWYDPARRYVNFLVIGGSGSCGGPTAAQATIVFGPPARTYQAAGYKVLVWHQNLLARLG